MKPSVLIVLALALVLAACDTTPTEGVPAESPEPEIVATPTLEPTDPSSTGLACLSGSWELVDIETYMNSVLPPDLAGGLTYVASSGTASAEFASDGTYTYSLDEFRVQYTMDMGAGPLPMEFYMDGEGHGTYEVIDDHTLSYTDMDSSGVTIAFTLAGEAIELGMDDAASAFGSAGTFFQYFCEGDTLQTIPPIDGALPVEYARVP